MRQTCDFTWYLTYDLTCDTGHPESIGSKPRRFSHGHVTRSQKCN